MQKIFSKKQLSLLLSTLLTVCLAFASFGTMTAKAATANYSWGGTVSGVASPISPTKEVDVVFSFRAESQDDGQNIFFTEDSTWSVSANDFDNQYCAVNFVPNNVEDVGVLGGNENTVHTDYNNHYYIMRYVKGQPMPIITPGLVDFIKKNGPGQLRFWLSDKYFGVTPCAAYWYWNDVTFDNYFHIGDTAPLTEAIKPDDVPAASTEAAASPTAEELVAHFDVGKTYTAEQAAAVAKDFVQGLKAMGVDVAPEFTNLVTAMNPVLGQALLAELGQTVSPAAEATPTAEATPSAEEIAAALAAAEAPAAETPAGSYTVVKGDCLFKIAQKAYGDGKQWRKIYEANKEQIKNSKEYIIYPGQTLNIPTIQ